MYQYDMDHHDSASNSLKYMLPGYMVGLVKVACFLSSEHEQILAGNQTFAAI